MHFKLSCINKINTFLLNRRLDYGAIWVCKYTNVTFVPTFLITHFVNKNFDKKVRAV